MAPSSRLASLAHSLRVKLRAAVGIRYFGLPIWA